jgi:CheY-like chemotaxis protein
MGSRRLGVGNGVTVDANGTASGAPAADNPQVNLHGLSKSDIGELSGSSVLFLAPPSMHTDNWRALMEFYAMKVQVVSSLPDMLAALRAAAVSPVPPSLSSVSGAPTASPPSSSLPLLLVDLDLPGVTDEQLMETLAAWSLALPTPLPMATPLRILKLYSRISAPLDVIASRAPGSPTSTAATAASYASASMSPPAPSVRSPLMTTTTISPAPLPSSSTSASANDVFSPCAGVAATALVSAPFVPHVQESGRGGGGSAALMVSVFDSDTSSAQSPQLVRSVQKPVRARQFVQLLLSMLRAEAVGSSPRSLLSPLVAAAAAAAGLPPSSDGSNGGGGDVRLASASSSLVAAGKGTKAARISRISDRYPLRILLAEDNPINQKMMVRRGRIAQRSAVGTGRSSLCLALC